LQHHYHHKEVKVVMLDQAILAQLPVAVVVPVALDN
jgi:hypothetical protein